MTPDSLAAHRLLLAAAQHPDTPIGGAARATLWWVLQREMTRAVERNRAILRTRWVNAQADIEPPWEHPRLQVQRRMALYKAAEPRRRTPSEEGKSA